MKIISEFSHKWGSTEGELGGRKSALVNGVVHCTTETHEQRNWKKLYYEQVCKPLCLNKVIRKNYLHLKLQKSGSYIFHMSESLEVFIQSIFIERTWFIIMTIINFCL